jgi:hypothetical protein
MSKRKRINSNAVSAEDFERNRPLLREFYEILGERLPELGMKLNRDPAVRDVCKRLRDKGISPSMIFEFGINYKKVKSVPRVYRPRVQGEHVAPGTYTRRDYKLLRDMKIVIPEKPSIAH